MYIGWRTSSFFPRESALSRAVVHTPQSFNGILGKAPEGRRTEGRRRPQHVNAVVFERK